MSTRGAVIFDLDGVLVDTVSAHDMAWSIVAARVGIPFDEDVARSLRGVRRVDALLQLVGAALSDDRIADLLQLKQDAYLSAVRSRGEDIRVCGANELLVELRASGFRIGVASASRNAAYLLQLSCLTDLCDFVSDGSFPTPKPAPDQFTYVAARLGECPSDCVVVEDSAAGMAAASRAGMIVVALAREFDGCPPEAHYRIGALREFPAVLRGL